MNKTVLGRLKCKELWQRVGVAFLIVAPLALIAAYGKRSETVRVPITEPHPVATTTQIAPNAFAGIDLIGEAAIVYDLSTGHTLYSQKADAQLPLASLTKLLTAYAGVTMLGPGAEITMSSTSLAAEGDNGFWVGETFAHNDLARFALVGSSNDAAEAIAEEVANRRATTVREALSAAAGNAGLSRTYAVNGSGLDVNMATSGGYGTARDMAILAGALVAKAPELAEATTESGVTIRSLNGIPYSLRNTNQGAIAVPGLMLSKTGFTDLAGGNLVVVVDAGIGHPVAVVVLGSTREGRFADVNELIDATQRYFAGIPN